MKRTIKRITAALLAAVMVVFSLSGCTDLLSGMMEFYDTYEDFYDDYYSDSGYGSYFDQMYGDYYGYSDSSDYYNDYYGYSDGGSEDYNTDYSDFYSYFTEYLNSIYGEGAYEDYYGTGETAGDSTTGGNTGGSDGTQTSGGQTVSSNILGEAIRDQFTEIKGNGRDVVTVMVYMCGSNLESDSGLATADLNEMKRATANSNLRIVVECGGTKTWKTSGISNGKNTRIEIVNGKINTLETKSHADMTDGDTLASFIKFCAEKYPANRNMLILWDHGSGAVDGWGYDEYNYNDTLTIDELGEALYDGGIKFDFIGFDACLMSTMEVACVLYDFADYMIASEDYESGYGWEYQPWLTALAKNTSTPTPELGKIICDDFITESGQDAAIMAITDLSYMKLVYSSWKALLQNEDAMDTLLDANFSWETQNTSRTGDLKRFGLEDLLGSLISTEADVDDMLAIAKAFDDVPEAAAVISALENAIIYCAANSQDANWTGLSVALPYGSSTTYSKMKSVFSKAGFDDEYLSLLSKFTSVSGSSMYDWSDWSDLYGGSGYDSWSDYYTGGSYDDSNYGWDSWYGWDDYNSSDYGWSDYDYYDYYNGNSSYDSYDFFDYYDFFSQFFGGDSGYGGYGNSGYGNDGWGWGYGY